MFNLELMNNFPTFKLLRGKPAQSASPSQALRDKFDQMKDLFIIFEPSSDCPEEVKAINDCVSYNEIHPLLKRLNNHPHDYSPVVGIKGNYWVEFGIRGLYLDPEVMIIKTLSENKISIPTVVGYRPLNPNKDDGNGILIFKVSDGLHVINADEKFSEKAKKNYLQLLKDVQRLDVNYPAFNEQTLLFEPIENAFYLSCPWVAKQEPKGYLSYVDYSKEEHNLYFINRAFG